MAFSGTISTTVFNTRMVVDTAIRRCKMPAQSITAEHIEIANNALYLMLSDLANRGVPLWCVERQVYPLYDGVGQITMDIGTVDVLSANLRSLQYVSGTEVVTATEHETEFEEETTVSQVGIKWNGASAPIVFERSEDGLSWDTVQAETPSAVAGEWTWFDLNSVLASKFFLVRATTGTLDYQHVVLGNTPSEIPIARLNRDQWVNLPNKSSKGRPLQYWFDRQVRQPIMHLWNVPSSEFEYQQVVLMRHRHIMDVGSLRQEIEVPQRWYEAIVAGLAAKCAGDIPEVDAAMIGILEPKAERALYIAQQEERDNSPINFMPMIGAYTR